MKNEIFQKSTWEWIDFTQEINSQGDALRTELYSTLSRYVVAQEEAKKAIIQTVIDGLFGVWREEWILGSVFLAGPTWVGKTELVKSLCRVLLWSPDRFTQIDCGGLKHPGDVGKLIGSGAGYVWYGDSPSLADTRVHAGYVAAKSESKLHPILREYSGTNFSIVLFDEAEKAHPEVFDILLWAMQSGRLELSSGKENGGRVKHSQFTDLSNTLFIFTSNVGERSISRQKKNSIGFTKIQAGGNWDQVTFQKEFEMCFDPEFRGRMDQIVRCHSLSLDQIHAAFDLHIDRLDSNLFTSSYLCWLRVKATRAYVEGALFCTKLEYWTRAITGVLKQIRTQIWFALRSKWFPNSGHAIITFDTGNNSNTIHVERIKNRDSLSPPPLQIDGKNVSLIIDTFIAQHSAWVNARIKNVTYGYIDAIMHFDNWFHNILQGYIQELQKLWFTSLEFIQLRELAYNKQYQTIDQPRSYEQIVYEDNMYEHLKPKWVRRLLSSRFMNQASNFGNCAEYIRTILGRELTESELIILGQYYFRLLKKDLSHD